MSIEIDIRLFGALELKSQHGSLIENRGEKPYLFLLLKYLLLEPAREADQEEVLRLVWRDTTVNSTALRVRLRRLREMVEPLQPEGGKGLIVYKAGRYRLEPAYTLRFDTDAFLALLKKVDTCPLNDAEGLSLCEQALELVRGPLLEYTEETVWLTGYRDYYQREFVRLGHETLNRMRALNDTIPTELLCERSLILAPENEALQRDIIAFLTEHQMETELAKHMLHLERSGKAVWLKDPAQEHADKRTEANQLPPEVVKVRLFGDVELYNPHGHIVENRSRTPLLLLKYLLLKHPKQVTMDEILQLWPISKGGVDPESTVAVRLRRAREALRPLQLDKKKGLIQYQEGLFWLNPAYTVIRDVDVFADLMKQSAAYPLTDPEGLSLCVQALELFRGPLLEYTNSEPWLEEYRSCYQDAFCRLAVDTLKRIKVLHADANLPLLAQRAAAIVPEQQDLHEAILHCLSEKKDELELIRYLSLLSRSGKAEWVKTSPPLSDM